MAKIVKLKIDADTRNAEQGMDRVDSSISKTVKSLALATAGLLALKKGFDFMKGSVDLSIKQEETFRKLQSSVELTGKSWGDAKIELDGMFASLQAVTKYGDTDSAEVLQQLITLSGDYEKSVSALPIVLDMASSGLFDVNTAARYVGMALSGNIEMMGRYIPQLKASVSPQLASMNAMEKTAFALDLFKEKFGGLAQKEMNTTSGKWKQFQLYWGDLREAIGDDFLGTIKYTTNKILPLIKEWTTAIKLHQTEVDLTGDAYKNMGEDAKIAIISERIELLKTAKTLETHPNILQVMSRTATRAFGNMSESLLKLAGDNIILKGAIVLAMADASKAFANYKNAQDAAIDPERIAEYDQEIMNLALELENLPEKVEIDVGVNLPDIDLGLLNEITLLLNDLKMREFNIPEPEELTPFYEAWIGNIAAVVSAQDEQLDKEIEGIKAIQKAIEEAEKRKMELKVANAALAGNSASKAMKSVVKAETMEAIAGYISSVLKTVPFPANVLLAAAGGGLVSGLMDKALSSIPNFSGGGDFVVPSGYPNDSYPMLVESGERVQITPANAGSSQTDHLLSMLIEEIRNKPVANTIMFDDIEMARYVESGQNRRIVN